MSSRGPTISAAMEDYLKAIHQIADANDGGAVSTQALADRLRVSTASVTGMIKRLDGLRLVAHEPYHGVRLTPRGEAIALEVLRHHRLLELYLVEHLGMTWDEVHAEADRLEHHISEGLEDRIAAKLGQPSRDPHGDPIPGRDGTMVAEPTAPLAALASGDTARIVRVSDRAPKLLQYLAERGLRPGAEVEVVDVDEMAGVIAVRVAERDHVLALTTAAEIQVAA
jgi:DtxR family transcriptional regulator, Mn-dependent transcriptional regulator